MDSFLSYKVNSISLAKSQPLKAKFDSPNSQLIFHLSIYGNCVGLIAALKYISFRLELITLKTQVMAFQIELEQSPQHILSVNCCTI